MDRRGFIKTSGLGVAGAWLAGSRYAQERGRELSVLTHSEARQSVQAAGIRLIHFGQL